MVPSEVDFFINREENGITADKIGPRSHSSGVSHWYNAYGGGEWSDDGGGDHQVDHPSQKWHIIGDFLRHPSEAVEGFHSRQRESMHKRTRADQLE